MGFEIIHCRLAATAGSLKARWFQPSSSLPLVVIKAHHFQIVKQFFPAALIFSVFD